VAAGKKEAIRISRDSGNAIDSVIISTYGNGMLQHGIHFDFFFQAGGA
jgi:hypothetical protein